MKKLMLFLWVISFSLCAQTGIGTTTPDASAKLDITATDKGFLPPRVALTSTNSAAPINNPANGLMIFNTATTGPSPFNVVPGYYFWDGTGQQWVSISTTVGNVQNQAIFRSTTNTNANDAISSWNSRFNNIASGDLSINSSIFTLSNGIYKLEWALPYQSSNTFNSMQLQELSSGTWSSFRGDGAYANLSNGGNTDWGGGTFAADILDCSSASKSIRIINNDGASRTLFKGVTLIITKLNPSITTSTTADNLGNHIANSNIQLNNNYLSNDGGNEGIRIDNSGNVGIGNNSPTSTLDVTGSLAVSGAVNLKNTVNVGTGSGLEGGEIDFSTAANGNTSLSGNSVAVDVYGDKLRIFENGGTNRGVNIDLSKAPINASGDLLWKKSASNLALNTTLSLDNLAVQIKTQGSNPGGPWIFAGTVSGSADYVYSITYQLGAGANINAQGTTGTMLATTSLSTVGSSGWYFTNVGSSAVALITDTSTNKMYRVTYMMTNASSPYGNYVTIERIL